MSRTYATLFDTEEVDELVGGAFKKLEGDFLKRRDHMSAASRQACEARLDLLRRTWQILLDKSPD